MTRRSYGQYCALARTLDLVGERWTLLVVRELMLGPRRYSDVLASLPGVGTSLLAERLKRLQESGLAVRRELPPPAASTVYELTPKGRELARALLPLAMWGARHLLGPLDDNEEFRIVWPLLVMREYIDPRQLDPDLDETYEFVVDGSTGYVHVHGGQVDVRDGAVSGPPTVRFTSDVETFIAVGMGDLDPASAVRSGQLVVDGDPEAAMRLLSLAPVNTVFGPASDPEAGPSR